MVKDRVSHYEEVVIKFVLAAQSAPDVFGEKMALLIELFNEVQQSNVSLATINKRLNYLLNSLPAGWKRIIGSELAEDLVAQMNIQRQEQIRKELEGSNADALKGELGVLKVKIKEIVKSWLVDTVNPGINCLSVSEPKLGEKKNLILSARGLIERYLANIDIVNFSTNPERYYSTFRQIFFKLCGENHDMFPDLTSSIGEITTNNEILNQPEFERARIIIDLIKDIEPGFGQDLTGARVQV